MAVDRHLPAITWIDDAEFAIGDVAFRAAPWKRFESTAERFCVVKRPELVQHYATLIAELAPRTIFELGILVGGSTAFLSQLARPEKLVALDVRDGRVAALDDYIADHGLSESVKAYFGVDQGDAARLRTILAEDFAGSRLDLVVDDASHHVDLTRASFNVLFPHVRPGGLFIIEDWAWAHVAFSAHRPDETPLTKLVFEMVLACPSAPGLISDVSVDRHWTLVRRGPLEVDPNTFDISACFSDRGRALLTP